MLWRKHSNESTPELQCMLSAVRLFFHTDDKECWFRWKNYICISLLFQLWLAHVSADLLQTLRTIDTQVWKERDTGIQAVTSSCDFCHAGGWAPPGGPSQTALLNAALNLNIGNSPVLPSCVYTLFEHDSVTVHLHSLTMCMGYCEVKEKIERIQQKS